ncbi:hypothetical protein [Aeromonas salmonicida]|uniref:hypothetical protein n=1 Tax=Aeromonas salmonicida TaxID=645 RepID=UPI0013EFBD4D|nr:hypothetical protein [Aeromonas salmonicida]
MNIYFSRLIKLLLPLLFFLPGVYPFINGVGCKFNFVHDGRYNFQEGVCKGGVLDVYIKSKTDDSVIVKRLIWGVTNNYVYTYKIGQKFIKGGRVEDVDRINNLYEASSLISGYRVKLEHRGNKHMTFYEQPMEIIYVSKIKGRMGFLN